LGSRSGSKQHLASSSSEAEGRLSGQNPLQGPSPDFLWQVPPRLFGSAGTPS